MSKYLRSEAGFQTFSNNWDKKKIPNSQIDGGKYEQSHQAETSWFYSCSRKAYLPRLITADSE